MCEGRKKKLQSHNFVFQILINFCLWHFLCQIGEEDDINQMLDYVLALANCDAMLILMRNSMPSTSYFVSF